MRPRYDVKAMRRPALLASVSAVALGCGVLFAGCGSSTSGPAQAKPAAQSRHAALNGQVLSPLKPAPATTLRDSLGHTVSLSDYRGKAVFVTFIYDHCPDTCPLIVSHLRTTQQLLGKQGARKMQAVAISADPRGDTPATVRSFLAAHRMTGRMEYLLGSRPQLERVWKAWGIGAKADPSAPDAVEHSALIFGVSGSGRVTTLYPANFKPSDVAHDVPLLAAR